MLDTELENVTESVAEFVRNKLNPLILSNKQSLFESCWKACGDSGLLGLHIESEFGGQGSTVQAAVNAMISLGEHCVDNGFAFAVNASLFSHASTVACAGSNKLKRRYLTPLCKGQSICAYALTEEKAGSDAYALETKAEKVSEGYLLNGSKTFITLGPVAEVAIVFASTNPERKQWGITAFLVDLSSNGVVSEVIDKSGLKSIPMGRLTFKNCVVSKENILGKVGSGAAVFEESQMWERSFVMASHVGMMKRQLDAAVSYVTEREQFSKPIGQFQSVSNRVADMRVRLETSRLILQHVAKLKDAGKSIRMESALLKIHLSESVLDSSLDAVRIQGAKGYTGEAEVFTQLADSVAGLMMAGTNDIQRGIVSRLLGI